MVLVQQLGVTAAMLQSQKLPKCVHSKNTCFTLLPIASFQISQVALMPTVNCPSVRSLQDSGKHCAGHAECWDWLEVHTIT